MNNLINETGLASPEQKIKDVFKTSPENKAWMAGDAFSITDIEQRLQQAAAEKTISLGEVQKQLEQIKAFQTHGT